jgi:four helix bundle protein
LADNPAGTKKTFEDLHVYQQARDLANHVYRLTRQAAFAKDYGLVDQVRRAAVSVMSNIAEGFERGTNAELVQFLYIAKGSCGEVRAQLSIACDQGYIAKDDHDRLANQCRLTSGMLSNFIAHLKGSPLRGPKFTRSRHDPAVAAMDEQIRVLNELAGERKRKQQDTNA